MLQNPKYNMNYISNFLVMRNATTNVSASSLPQSPQILGPQQTNTNSIDTDCELDETQLEKLGASAAGKSFTIASILGLKKKNAATTNSEAGQNQKPKELNAMNLSIHNNQNFQLQNKAFGGIDVDNRLLQNRIPLSFAHHHLQNPNAHQQAPHFYPQPNNVSNNNNNNNNNNLSVTNHNGAASALQSLQQQFHAKGGSNFPPFHGKEQHHPRNKNDHTIKGGKSSLKSKRVRTIFTPEQLERLEAEFERQQYMVGPERLYLAHTLQLTEAQVKVWFQNRRIKWRKHHLEMTQQRLAIIRQCQSQPINGGAGNDARVGTNDKSSGGHILPSSSPALTEFDRESATTTGNETTGARDSSELSICTNSMDSSPDGI